MSTLCLTTYGSINMCVSVCLCALCWILSHLSFVEINKPVCSLFFSSWALKNLFLFYILIITFMVCHSITKHCIVFKIIFKDYCLKKKKHVAIVLFIICFLFLCWKIIFGVRLFWGTLSSPLTLFHLLDVPLVYHLVVPYTNNSELVSSGLSGAAKHFLLA